MPVNSLALRLSKPVSTLLIGLLLCAMQTQADALPAGVTAGPSYGGMSEFRLANGLTERVNRAAEGGVYPALVTSVGRRRFLRTVVQAKGLHMPVLSYEEIGTDARPSLIGQVPA